MNNTQFVKNVCFRAVPCSLAATREEVLVRPVRDYEIYRHLHDIIYRRLAGHIINAMRVVVGDAPW